MSYATWAVLQEDFYAVADWAHRVDPWSCISVKGVTEKYRSSHKADAAWFVHRLLDDLQVRISSHFNQVCINILVLLLFSGFKTCVIKSDICHHLLSTWRLDTLLQDIAFSSRNMIMFTKSLVCSVEIKSRSKLLKSLLKYCCRLTA